MKVNKKLLVLLAAMLMLCMTTIAVYAAGKVSASDYEVKVDTDKDTYSAGEKIVLLFDVLNKSALEAEKINMQYDIPESIKENISNLGSLPTTIEKLGAGKVAVYNGSELVVKDIDAGDADVVDPPKTGDTANNIIWMVVIAATALILVVCQKKKIIKKASYLVMAGILLAGTVCGAGLEAYAATYSFEVSGSKTITYDGKEYKITVVANVIVEDADADVPSHGDIDITGNYKRVSVHDPSIVKDPETGMYYIFGSHMAWAKSKDLVNWETFTNNINRDYKTLFAKAAEWSALGSKTYDVSGNLWAPDVIWNEAMNKWCMYMSVNGDYWYTSIVLLTADSLEGDWTYVGPVVYSGFTNAEEAAKTDFAKVMGTNEVPARYLENRNGSHTYGMNAIDPCVKYDEDGNLWMTYGSWFGGIYMLKLDGDTGLRDYDYTYKTVANESDEYQGLKIAGGQHVSGEASYIEKIGNHWYLFMSYGGLTATGGYNMRVFRADEITGPYVDLSGDDARYTVAGNNINGTVGIKIFGNYQWSTMKYGNVAQGHNSLLTDDDGKAYVVYHTRFADGTEGHQVRVHQLFENKDGWLVAAPYEYTGETLSETGYDVAEMTGTYEVLFHKQSINYSQLECATPQKVTLNEDGTVSGDYTGTWAAEKNSPYVTMTLGGVEYNGVFVKQYIDETTYETMCFTILGDNEVEMWGSKYLTGKNAVDLTISLGKVKVPASTMSDISFVTEGLYGTTVSYASEDTSVIANDGTVTRSEKDKNVKVTVTYKNGDYTYSQDYTIIVIGKGGAGDKILVGEYYTDSPINLSNAAEGTYQVPNPYNTNVTAGLQIYNGVSIEFDVEGTGDRLSNIISFNDTSGKFYFTGGSYLGYNATGGYFDANLNSGYVAGNDYIKGSAHIRIDIDATGYYVYSNGELAYSSEDIESGKIPGDKGTLTSYANMLKWLNTTAETINFGWGNWWSDSKFNGTISNVKLYANAVEEIDTSDYAYYEDFLKGDLSKWLGKTDALTIENNGDARGNYLKFVSGSDSGNRGAYTMFDSTANVSGNYTITVETALTAGVLTQRSESAFAILGTDASGHTANAAVTSGYILKLYNVPPAGTAANQTDKSMQTKWEVNGSGEYADIPVGEWVTITADVNTKAGEVAVKIVTANGTVCYDGTVAINGTGELGGIQILRGRGVGTASLDTITVKVNEDSGDSGETDPVQEPTTATVNVEGKAYPDKNSVVTLTFTADAPLSTAQKVKINGTTVVADSTVDMVKVNSITYNDNTCTVELNVSAIGGWHKVNGSYDIELVNGTETLASKNVSYELDMSADTAYTAIEKDAENAYTSAYYKVEGTKLYVMTIIKSDKIHCDGVKAGDTTYGWWNGIASELYMECNGTIYNVGSHVYNGIYSNPISWNNDATLVNSTNSVRSYMALGTFDNDDDIDTGCILLNLYDLADIGLTADTISGLEISFSGFIGPNDGGIRFVGIDSTKKYTLNNN